MCAQGRGASDAALAQLAVAGDAKAFDELVRRALPAVRAILRRMGAAPAVVDDVSQDAFIAALRSVGSYRADASFAAWVMRIAARLFLKRGRAEARFVPLEESVADDAHAIDVGSRMDLDRALAGLSPAERLCVALCHGAGFTHAEIAVELGMPLGTVKSHVLRGTRRLREHLGIP